VKNELYNVVTGKDILTLSDEASNPLIEDFLFEKDYVLLVAEEKAGKTIFAQQIACCLTSGTPFLGSLEVPKPVDVWYFATEGKEDDLKDRFIRMSKGVDLNPDRLKLIPSRFRFNTREGRECLRALVNRYQDCLPKVIIVDALYRAVKGSIKEDEVVNDFHHIMGTLSHECDAAVILVHHFRKPTRDDTGTYVNRSDDDTFGSAFLKAAVDHCFWLEKCRKDSKDRILRCDTQRSGNIVDNMRLKLIQPDPLYFEAVSSMLEEKHKILTLMSAYKEGLSVSDIEFRSKIARTTIYRTLKELLNEGKIGKNGGKTKIYNIIRGEYV